MVQHYASLGTGTTIIPFEFYHYPVRIKKISIDVDNDVTITDKHNLVCGKKGTSPLTLSGHVDLYPDVVFTVGTLEFFVVTTTTTKIFITIETEAVTW